MAARPLHREAQAGMIFEALNDSLEARELLLWHGGMCRFHLCKRGKKTGQVTIHEILVHPQLRRGGIGRRMIEHLKWLPGGRYLVAKCPVDLPANAFWGACGFTLSQIEMTRSGRELNVWCLASSSVSEATSKPCKSLVTLDGSRGAAAATPSIPVVAR
jgi:GNAT superfamily N-acetyltransferase